jgi:mono/diheme cytochrome c family protein
MMAGIALLCCGCLAACGTPRRSEPVAGPIALDEQLTAGRLLYDRHCYKCHGQGDGGMSPALNNKPLPRFAIKYQIRHGIGAMPAFSYAELSEEDAQRIADYLVALRKHPD